MQPDALVNILLVDDQPNNLFVLAAVLENLEVNLVMAYSGKQAYQCALEQDFAVVLLDVNMPGMDGFETAELIRSIPRASHTPIIFITGSSIDDKMLKAYSMGAVDYIQKPIGSQILRSKVSVFVDLYKKTEAIKRQAEQLRQIERKAHERERQQTLKALRVSEERFRITFEWAGIGIALVNDRGEIVESNPALRKMFGYDVESIYGKVFTDFLHPEDIPASQRLFQELVEGTRDHYQLEKRFLDKDGSVIWSNLTVTMVRQSNSDTKFAVCLIEDISDKKQVEEQRALLLEREQTARKEAEEANRAKDEFLAVLSHELRTPLTTILGWIELLSTNKFDEETYNQALEAIERGARTQAQLIDDLLDVSRIIVGKLKLDLVPADLESIVDSVIDAAGPSAQAKSIQLNKVIDASATVLGDHERLQQVMWNLLTNAIKFTPAGGSVTLRLRVEDGEAVLTVRDTGEGISSEFLPHVFERFRQADSTITRKHSGLGLGLAIVRHLVELHNGVIEADSEGSGHGSTFTVRLPLLARGEARDKSVNGLTATPPINEKELLLNSVRVLIVDDEMDTRKLFATILKHYGAEVITVGSSDEALRVLDENPPDVLLSDIAMPGENGYMLIAKVRQRAPEKGGLIPAAALTAYARAEDRITALEAGFQMHIAKPVEPSKLAEIVATLAGRHLKTGAAANMVK